MRPLESYRLVLVAPLYSGNVGAVARVAANFELGDLWIVAPQCDWQNAEAKMYAKGPAAEYLGRMKQVNRLSEALADCTAAVGFTRRGGGLRAAETRLAALAENAGQDGRTALVFGREDAGLTTDELMLCTSVCSFEVGETMPSLNLSHAVAVVCARLYEQAPKNKAALVSAGAGSDNAALATAASSTAASSTAAPLGDAGSPQLGELEALFTHWRQTMLDAGMTNPPNPDHPLNLIKRLIQRARPSKSDIAVLRAYLSKTQAAMGTRKRK